jgi:hypothetical protein
MKCKLLHYFESHPFCVESSFGHGEVVRNRLATGRITKWAIKLMGLYISYVPQMVIKCQALVDFVATSTETQEPPPPPRPITQEH